MSYKYYKINKTNIKVLSKTQTKYKIKTLFVEQIQAMKEKNLQHN